MPVAACSLYQAPRCRYSPVHVPNLVVQSQEGHWRVNGLPALGTEAYNLQSCLVDLLCELVHGDVTWGTDQHRPAQSGVGCQHHPGKLNKGQQWSYTALIPAGAAKPRQSK